MERISSEQKKLLVRLVEEYFQFVNGRFQSAQGAQYTYSVWERIQERLNAIGPVKSIIQWKKCWKDLRLGVKAKATKLRQYRTATGGGGPSNIKFTEEEDKIMSMVGIEMFDGAPDVPEGGLNIVTEPLRSPLDSTISFGPEDFEEIISPSVPWTSTKNLTRNATTIPISSEIQTTSSTEVVRYSPSISASGQSAPSTSTPIRRPTPLHQPTPFHRSTQLNRLTPHTSVSTSSASATHQAESTSASPSSTYNTPSGPQISNTAGHRRAPYLGTAVDKSMANQLITIELLEKILAALEKNNALLVNIDKGINKTNDD